MSLDQARSANQLLGRKLSPDDILCKRCHSALLADIQSAEMEAQTETEDDVGMSASQFSLGSNYSDGSSNVKRLKCDLFATFNRFLNDLNIEQVSDQR